MHAVQGAMAVRRERQKRQRRLSSLRGLGGRGKDAEAGSRRGDQMRTCSLQENLSSHIQLTEMIFLQALMSYAVVNRTSLTSEQPRAPSKPESSLTAFHLGVVFILIGFLLVFSSIITGSIDQTEWSRLLGVGVCLIIVGLGMVMVNRIITEREEEQLAKYVQQRLARTRSGHALVRDVDADADVEIIRLNPSANGPRRKRSARAGASGTAATAGRRQPLSGKQSLRGAASVGSVASIQERQCDRYKIRTIYVVLIYES